MDWCLAPDWMRLPSTRDDGLRTAAWSDESFSKLPSRLVRLEMHRFSFAHTSRIDFPETLRFLLLHYVGLKENQATTLSVKWPSQLEVLILWPHALNSLILTELLPPSLQHLALGTTQGLERGSKSLSKLPLLKTLQVGKAANLNFSFILPIEQLESCIVGSEALKKDAAQPPPNYHCITLVPNLNLATVKADLDSRFNASEPEATPSADALMPSNIEVPSPSFAFFSQAHLQTPSSTGNIILEWRYFRRTHNDDSQESDPATKMKLLTHTNETQPILSIHRLTISSLLYI